MSVIIRRYQRRIENWTSVCGEELSQVGIGSGAIDAIISCELWRNFGVF